MSLPVPHPRPLLLAALLLAPGIATAQISRSKAVVADPGPRTLEVLRPPSAGATLEQPLAAPTNLTVTPAATTASLRWDAVPGVVGYLVTRTSRLYGTIQQTPTPLTATSFTDVSQQFDPRYLHTYGVSAVYPGGRYAAATVSYYPPPASVGYPQHYGNRYVGATGWTTTWTAVPEATGYVVHYQLHMTNGGNAYWNVDTTFAVAAPATTHSLGEWNGQPGLYGNAPTAIRSTAVSAVFPNGGRSAATPAR
jgi:hypothetical protein